MWRVEYVHVDLLGSPLNVTTGSRGFSHLTGWWEAGLVGDGPDDG